MRLLAVKIRLYLRGLAEDTVRIFDNINAHNSKLLVQFFEEWHISLNSWESLQDFFVGHITAFFTGVFFATDFFATVFFTGPLAFEDATFDDFLVAIIPHYTARTSFRPYGMPHVLIPSKATYSEVCQLAHDLERVHHFSILLILVHGGIYHAFTSCTPVLAPFHGICGRTQSATQTKFLRTAHAPRASAEGYSRTRIRY